MIEQTTELRWLRVRSQRGGLWAIVDACEEPSVPRKAQELGGASALSLYRGEAEQRLWAIAPYLIRVDAALLDWLLRELWSEPWGIFALSAPERSIEDLRQHFRRFLTVESASGERWYFRFYDPRVLSGFLHGASPAQVAEMLGPLEALCVTDPRTYGIRTLSLLPIDLRS